MNETVMDGKKFYEKEYATKGVGNTALGLSIGALGVELLRNGGLNNLLGGIVGGQPQSEEQSFFGLYKTMRDADDAMMAKHTADSFALYKGQRDNFDILKAQIDALATKVAVQEAVQPWKDKSIYDAIALEAERRQSGDCSIVGYSNCTFIPQYIADITPAATSTPKVTYNPLNCMRPTCGC